MPKPLTIKTLENVKPGTARKEIPDGLVRSLFFIVQTSGKMSWAVRYRVAGRSRKLTLGTYPAIGLKAARELASRALVKVAEGGDPAGEKQAAKSAEPDYAADLIDEIGEQFILRHARGLRPNSARQYEWIMRKEIMAPVERTAALQHTQDGYLRALG